ncbi:MAG TPA: AsmA family protein, partial [Bacteroidales bacterium]|nr:AsmA family protein [Bacteroidales bacterium]
MSVKQKIKKISLWIGGIIAGLLIITSVLSYIYRDKIITFVTQELSSQLQGEIRIGKIDISFLSSFPNVSIQLHNIIAKSTPGFNTKEFNEYNTDTAFTAQKLSFVFNVIDFINERYIVQQIKVKGAYINLFIDSKGKHNMNFVKETNDTVQTNYFIELSKISIFKTHTHIHSAADKLYAHDYFDFAHISGKFLENGFSLFVDTEFKNHIISIDNQSFFPNLDID